MSNDLEKITYNDHMEGMNIDPNHPFTRTEYMMLALSINIKRIADHLDSNKMAEAIYNAMSDALHNDRQSRS